MEQMEGRGGSKWSPGRSVVADLHYFGEEQDLYPYLSERSSFKRWIRFWSALKWCVSATLETGDYPGSHLVYHEHVHSMLLVLLNVYNCSEFYNCTTKILKELLKWPLLKCSNELNSSMKINISCFGLFFHNFFLFSFDDRCISLRFRIMGWLQRTEAACFHLWYRIVHTALPINTSKCPNVASLTLLLLAA